jgi:hypothetical protein
MLGGDTNAGRIITQAFEPKAEEFLLRDECRLRAARDIERPTAGGR